MSRASEISEVMRQQVGAGVGKGAFLKKSRKEVLTRILALTRATIHDKYPGYTYTIDSDGQDMSIDIKFDEPFEPNVIFGKTFGDYVKKIFPQESRENNIDIHFDRKFGFKETVRKHPNPRAYQSSKYYKP